MQIARNWRLLGVSWAEALALVWAFGCPTTLWAASLGSPVLGGAGAVMGQPLDFVLPVRLEPGDQIGADCVAAEVVAGEHLIPAYELRVGLETVSPELVRVRVLTHQGVREPALTVVVNVGCPPVRQTRRYVILVEPGPSPVRAAPAQPQPAVPAAELPVVAAATDAAVAPKPVLPAERPRPKPATQPIGRPATGSIAKPTLAAAASPDTKSTGRQAANAAPGARLQPHAQPFAQPAPLPRLRLETLEPTAAGAAPGDLTARAASGPTKGASDSAGLTSAALTAEAMAVAASAVERSVRLEQLLEQSRVDLRSSREQVAQLRERLTQDQQAAGWAWPLLLLATLLGGVALWLGRRVLQLQTRSAGKASVAGAARAQVKEAPDTHGQLGWEASQHPSMRLDRGAAEQQTRSRLATAPLPFVPNASSAVPTPPAQPGHAAQMTHAWPPPAAHPQDAAASASPSASASPFTAAEGVGAKWGRAQFAPLADAAVPESPMAVTQPLSPLQRDLRSGSRDVSIEELIDLEQQAEFFIVLGQDDAAIDLLVDHLRGTGGTSPLPYLKLLEIYHRRADQLAYERTRARFNHRFNAWAPQWGADLAQGRGLDDYPGVLPRLTQVWPRPLDAMAELEALLFRKSRGDLFELPAYREVLFLYALARDLLDREAADSGNVDLLLPLADGSPFGSTAPLPFQLHGGDPTAANGSARSAQADPSSGVNASQIGASQDDRPTAPVDFDLSAPAPPSSIFDSPQPRTVHAPPR